MAFPQRFSYIRVNKTPIERDRIESVVKKRKSRTKCFKVDHGGLFVTGTRLVEYCILKEDLVLPSTCALPPGFDLQDEYPICKYMQKISQIPLPPQC